MHFRSGRPVRNSAAGLFKFEGNPVSQHFAFVCLPALGHLNPVLAVAETLVSRGHRVTIPTAAAHRERVEAIGAAAPLYTSPLLELAAPARMAARAQGQAPEMNPVSVFRMFFQEAVDTFPLIEELLDGDRPDVLIYDQLSWAGWLLADKWRLPHVRSYPSMAANEHYSMWRGHFDTAEDPEGTAAAGEMISKARAELGLPPMDLFGFDIHLPDLAVAFMTRSFQHAGETFDERFHFVGPCLGSRPSNTTWQPPAGDLPLVYVSLGTTYNQQLGFYRAVLDAFRDEPCHVVLAIGGQVDPADLGEVPANVELHAHAPQLEILAHASVFITHCGMGGTQEGLNFSVPMIGVPQMPEQQINADRMAELGFGRRILPAEVTAERLRTAVFEVLADPAIRSRLAEVRSEIHHSGGAVRAAEVLELAAGTPAV
ncbi:glycosyltransferase [Pseudonocardiaceae bacterium YIM PH 21723]|nr:glycosyltransferase [Pseudonocardiaceae bacterium YIM PH 21723]